MKLKPLGDRLIVQAVDEEETTASGIVLPDTAKEKPQRGKVLAVGDGKFDEDGEKRIPLEDAPDLLTYPGEREMASTALSRIQAAL